MIWRVSPITPGDRVGGYWVRISVVNLVGIASGWAGALDQAIHGPVTMLRFIVPDSEPISNQIIERGQEGGERDRGVTTQKLKPYQPNYWVWEGRKAGRETSDGELRPPPRFRPYLARHLSRHSRLSGSHRRLSQRHAPLPFPSHISLLFHLFLSAVLLLPFVSRHICD